MRRKSAGGRPRPLRVLRGGKANCSRFHCSSVRSVGYKVVFCILPYSKPRLDIRCPRTQKDQKMIFQTRSKWDGASWTNLNAGLSGQYSRVYALSASGTNLYVGG